MNVDESFIEEIIESPEDFLTPEQIDSLGVTISDLIEAASEADEELSKFFNQKMVMTVGRIATIAFVAGRHYQASEDTPPKISVELDPDAAGALIEFLLSQG